MKDCQPGEEEQRKKICEDPPNATQYFQKKIKREKGGGDIRTESQGNSGEVRVVCK